MWQRQINIQEIYILFTAWSVVVMLHPAPITHTGLQLWIGEEWESVLSLRIYTRGRQCFGYLPDFSFIKFHSRTCFKIHLTGIPRCPPQASIWDSHVWHLWTHVYFQRNHYFPPSELKQNLISLNRKFVSFSLPRFYFYFPPHFTSSPSPPKFPNFCQGLSQSLSLPVSSLSSWGTEMGRRHWLAAGRVPGGSCISGSAAPRPEEPAGRRRRAAPRAPRSAGGAAPGWTRTWLEQPSER